MAVDGSGLRTPSVIPRVFRHRFGPKDIGRALALLRVGHIDLVFQAAPPGQVRKRSLLSTRHAEGQDDPLREHATPKNSSHFQNPENS